MDIIVYSKNWRLIGTFYRPTREFWRAHIQRIFGVGSGVESEEDADFVSCMNGDWKYIYIFVSIPGIFYFRIQLELLIRNKEKEEYKENLTRY